MVATIDPRSFILLFHVNKKLISEDYNLTSKENDDASFVCFFASEIFE